MIKSLLIVGIGGFFGSSGRFLLQHTLLRIFPGIFPWGTFLANVIGCFLIGIVFAFSIKEDPISVDWKLFLAAGFCGGFTTFSSFSQENVHMLQNGHFLTFFGYLAASILLGFGATYLGMVVFR